MALISLLHGTSIKKRMNAAVFKYNIEAVLKDEQKNVKEIFPYFNNKKVMTQTTFKMSLIARYKFIAEVYLYS